MKISLLSCKELECHLTEEEMLVTELEALGNKVTIKNWEDFVDEGEDLFVIRTTWNYTKYLTEFLNKLETIQNRLVNSFELVKWNSNKSYLLELQEKGIQTIPLKIVENESDLQKGIDELGGDEFIVKPLVGASAWGLKRFLKTDELPEVNEPLILQRFLKDISKGEVSLFFLKGEFAYACEKIPRAGDIRVQEEYGGFIKQIVPNASLLQIARDAVAAIEFENLYVRVDIVPGHGLIELECIEPSMYYSKTADAAKKFAQAISTWRKS